MKAIKARIETQKATHKELSSLRDSMIAQEGRITRQSGHLMSKHDLQHDAEIAEIKEKIAQLEAKMPRPANPPPLQMQMDTSPSIPPPSIPPPTLSRKCPSCPKTYNKSVKFVGPWGSKVNLFSSSFPKKVV